MNPFEKVMQTTTWRNPTNHAIQARIFTGPVTGFQIFRVGPGESKDLPSQYDVAIRKEHNGKVTGGMAPQLIRVHGKNPPLDPAIDSDAAQKRAKEQELQAAAVAKAAADLRVAHATIAVVEKGEVEAEERPQAQPEKQPERPQAQAQQERHQNDQRPQNRGK